MVLRGACDRGNKAAYGIPLRSFQSVHEGPLACDYIISFAKAAVDGKALKLIKVYIAT